MSTKNGKSPKKEDFDAAVKFMTPCGKMGRGNC